MKKFYLILLLTTACGRIGVHELPEDEDAAVSEDGGKKPRDDGGQTPDSSTDASTPPNDAGVGDTGLNDGSISTDSGDASFVSLDGTWIVQLPKMDGGCPGVTVTYEDLWTIESNGTQLVSNDYTLIGDGGTFTGESVNARYNVQVKNTNGKLTGTHRMESLAPGGTVLCAVVRTVRGELD